MGKPQQSVTYSVKDPVFRGTGVVGKQPKALHLLIRTGQKNQRGTNMILLWIKIPTTGWSFCDPISKSKNQEGRDFPLEKMEC